MKKYKLIDSGDNLKLEQFGKYSVVRPSAYALWSPLLQTKWKQVDFSFSRKGEKKWEGKDLFVSWSSEIENILFKLKLTPFGHLGVFPEHQFVWKYIRKKITKKNQNILNLFAYTGGATLASALAGAKVCHVDASKPVISWAKENAVLNGLQDAPIRYISDDVFKFLKREIKRKVKYDGIILDPPTFGRGTQNEVFKLEKDISLLMNLCKDLLSEDPSFVIFTSHTFSFTPKVLENLLKQFFPSYDKISSGELIIDSEKSYSLSSGTYCIAEW